MKKIITILGRTGAGKDFIARQLSDLLNIPMIVSYTTRPIRENEVNGREHWFITKEKMEIKKQSAIAYTQIGEYEYCVSDTDLKDVNIYVIDPKGLNDLKKLNYDLYTVYVFARSTIRHMRATEIRKDNLEVFDKRDSAEDDMFTKYEESGAWNDLYVNEYWYDNTDFVGKIKNFLK